MPNKNKKHNKGFTLIETLVALFILSLVFASVISLMSSTVFSARYAKNEIKAMYLAQEGIDYVRNLRDSIAFRQNDWASFSTDVNTDCGGPDGCIIDKPFLVGHFASPQFIPAPPLPTTQGSFLNVINTECVNVFATCDELKVTSTVYWRNGSLTKSRSLKTSLTQWN